MPIGKISETTAQLIIWCVAFAGVTTLVAIDKIPANSIEMVLFWAAGTLGGKALNKKQAEVGNDSPG